jgi:hypothetical protein
MACALVRALGAAALLLIGAAAHADDRLWILTGEVYQSDYYFGAGLLIPFWGDNHLGQGWVQRYWLDTFSYTYDANGRDIDAKVFGAEAMIGYQASRPGLSGAAYFGVRYSNSHLSPDDPAGALRGQQFWPKAQLEGEATLSSSWRANGIISYIMVLDGYWARAPAVRPFRNEVHRARSRRAGRPELQRAEDRRRVRRFSDRSKDISDAQRRISLSERRRRAVCGRGAGRGVLRNYDCAENAGIAANCSCRKSTNVRSFADT